MRKANPYAAASTDLREQFLLKPWSERWKRVASEKFQLKDRHAPEQLVEAYNKPRSEAHLTERRDSGNLYGLTVDRRLQMQPTPTPKPIMATGTKLA